MLWVSNLDDFMEGLVKEPLPYLLVQASPSSGLLPPAPETPQPTREQKPPLLDMAPPFLSVRTVCGRSRPWWRSNPPLRLHLHLLPGREPTGHGGKGQGHGGGATGGARPWVEISPAQWLSAGGRGCGMATTAPQRAPAAGALRMDLLQPASLSVALGHPTAPGHSHGAGGEQRPHTHPRKLQKAKEGNRATVLRKTGRSP